MIVSLDDQLEWQESSRSHSPKTPSAPEVLESLRKNSPPPTPSRGNALLQSTLSLKELAHISGVEALIRFSAKNLLKSARMRGESLLFQNGDVVPISLKLPLKVRVLSRNQDDAGNKSPPKAQREDVDIGSVWVSLIAEYTYETQLASLLRSRKGLVEIALDERRIINRYFCGDLGVKGLQTSGLLPISIDACPGESLNYEESLDGEDVISLRVRRVAQLETLEGKRAILQDQQNRLRKLLARELQRQHSNRTTTTSASTTSIGGSIPSSNPTQGSPNLVNVVSSMLKKRNQIPTDTSKTTESEQSSVMSDEKMQNAITDPFRYRFEDELVNSKLRAYRIELYRVTSRLAECIENQSAMERRIKRLRYESVAKISSIPIEMVDH